jgi:drug/metabolite transporter (DMT)-like permease
MGPVWVWLGLGERPSDAAIAGGAIVIGALLVNGLWGMRGRANSV